MDSSESPPGFHLNFMESTWNPDIFHIPDVFQVNYSGFQVGSGEFQRI
jgi:hypothetical protein